MTCRASRLFFYKNNPSKNKTLLIPCHGSKKPCLTSDLQTISLPAWAHLWSACKQCCFAVNYLILESFTKYPTNPQTLACFPQSTDGQLPTVAALRGERRKVEEDMTLGQGSWTQPHSTKRDLGLVNTDESVWKLWEKDRWVTLWCLSSEKQGLKERTMVRRAGGESEIKCEV